MKKSTKRGEWFVESVSYRPMLSAYIGGLVVMRMYEKVGGAVSITIMVLLALIALFRSGFEAGWRRTK